MNTKQFFCRFETRRTVLAPLGEPVHCAKDVVEFLRKAIYNDPGEMWREISVALYLNKAQQIIGYEELSVGGIDSCTFDPRPLYRTALERMAYGVIFVHNHPTGNCAPSPKDINAIDRLRKGLSTLDLILYDSIIFAEKEAYSFAEEKVIHK